LGGVYPEKTVAPPSAADRSFSSDEESFERVREQRER
jgi:hypothetical protein